MTVINPFANLGGATAALQKARQTWTFVAGTTGAVATHTLFTITGRVYLDLITAFCTTTLTSGGTPAITVGVTGAVAQLVPAPTGGAPGIVTNDWWATAVSPQLIANPLTVVTGGTVTGSRSQLIAADIVLDIPVSTVTGGVLIFDVWYLPVTDGSGLVATTPA